MSHTTLPDGTIKQHKPRGGYKGGAINKRIPDAKKVTLLIPAPLVKQVKAYVLAEIKKYKKSLKKL